MLNLFQILNKSRWFLWNVLVTSYRCFSFKPFRPDDLLRIYIVISFTLLFFQFYSFNLEVLFYFSLALYKLFFFLTCVFFNSIKLILLSCLSITSRLLNFPPSYFSSASRLSSPSFTCFRWVIFVFDILISFIFFVSNLLRLSIYVMCLLLITSSVFLLTPSKSFFFNF